MPTYRMPVPKTTRSRSTSPVACLYLALGFRIESFRISVARPSQSWASPDWFTLSSRARIVVRSCPSGRIIAPTVLARLRAACIGVPSYTSSTRWSPSMVFEANPCLLGNRTRAKSSQCCSNSDLLLEAALCRFMWSRTFSSSVFFSAM